MSSPIALTIITVLLWSSAGAFAKSFNVPGNASLYIITVVSVLISFEVTAWYKHGRLFFPSMRELFSRKAVFSSLGFGIYWLTLGLSIERAGNASIPMALNCTWPLFTALFFVLFFSKEKGNIFDRSVLISGLGMLVGFTGILILFLGDQYSDNSISASASALALLTGAAFGLYGAYSSTLNEKDQLPFLILSCITGLIILTGWALVQSQNILELSLFHIALAIIMGVFVDGLGTFLWTTVNRLVQERGDRISSLTSLTLALPFLTALLLYFLFGEVQIFQASFLIGLVFLVIGTAICNRSSKPGNGS